MDHQFNFSIREGRPALRHVSQNGESDVRIGVFNCNHVVHGVVVSGDRLIDDKRRVRRAAGIQCTGNHFAAVRVGVKFAGGLDVRGILHDDLLAPDVRQVSARGVFGDRREPRRVNRNGTSSPLELDMSFALNQADHVGGPVGERLAYFCHQITFDHLIDDGDVGARVEHSGRIRAENVRARFLVTAGWISRFLGAATNAGVVPSPGH
mmetsp:Transcript_37013/g.54352  ORF Transcript_37013/g.54352 Transcript_37013/m.54352 type:complete len:208 (-) Transcript_37013:2148-2771(-)